MHICISLVRLVNLLLDQGQESTSRQSTATTILDILRVGYPIFTLMFDLVDL